MRQLYQAGTNSSNFEARGSKLRIAWIVPGFQANEQDRCIPALTDLAHGIAAEHDLSVFALQYPGREDVYQIGKVKIYSFRSAPLAAVPKVRQIGPLWRARQRLLEEHKAAPFDAVHGFWAAEPALLALQVRKSLQMPAVVSVMGGEAVSLPEIGYGAYRHRLDRFYLRYALRHADYLTAGSQTLADYLSRGLGVRGWGSGIGDLGAGFARDNPLPKFVEAGFTRDKGLRVLPLGVDTGKFYSEERNFSANTVSLLAVGSLLPVKGHANLVRAFFQIVKQRPDLDLRLRIVGEGICRAELERIITEPGLAGKVVLAGAVAPEQMPEEYRAAELFALSSYYESQCVALCEALACGLPVLASPVGLAPELLEQSAIGELAASNQPEALAAALLRLLERQQKWPAMSRAARQLAEERLSLQVCTSRFINMYRDIVKAKLR